MSKLNSATAGARTQHETAGPNKLLPAGAHLLSTPIKKKAGGYVPMEFDAEGDYFGITWLRAKGGLGGRGDREDWVADIPGLCIGIHDYHWNGHEFGANHGSFLGAIKAEMEISLQYGERNEQELLNKLTSLREGLSVARAAIALAGGTK